MKYYYVVLGSEWDVYRTIYSDLDSNESALYVPGLTSLYGKKLARYLNSVIIRIKKIPLGRFLIYPLYIKLKRITKPLCFIFFGNWVEYEVSLCFMEYLRKLFPHSRYVWFMQDIVETHPRIKACFTALYKKFDIILSYDFQDCKRYGLIYYPTGFSSILIDEKGLPTSDIYFIGKAKNRLKEIIKSFESFRNMGLKTDFNLVGVPEHQQVYPEEIHYIKGMSYLENLKHLKGSRCVLEIMQEGGSGFTLRINEALYFNKKIISNNKWLKNAPFYDKDNIIILNDELEMEDSFLEKIKNSKPIDYKYKEKLSPLRLLEFIDSKLT